ncbi:MAG: hypothetical protein KDK27_19095, partial [Leptospiraceae bacterium]|nr:hypothetical protein [Leptospiraceae bacterium]
FTLTFSVGGGPAPTVQAVGLASQNCSTLYPGTGSAIGGDHTLNSCWWDSSLPKLSATNYEFRGGDTGGGSNGSPIDCTPVLTDDIRITFNTFMDTAVTGEAITLTRNSPPSSTIRVASVNWTDCNTAAPYGCRVVTIAFAEAEASCNGNILFGDVNTQGDFNLLPTIPSVQDFPLYTIEVDTTARSADGIDLPAKFNFAIEGD